MIQIRTTIFETNSSSSHSVVMSSKDRGYCHKMPVDKNGKLVIRFGEFGWGPEVLYTPYEKLCYWMTEYANEFWYDWKDEYKDKTFEEKVQIFANKPEIKKAIKEIKKHCKNVKTIEFASPDEEDIYYNFGYIDHDSVGLVRGEDFENLIFNNSVIIVIDNDNSNYFKPWNDVYYDDNEATLRDPEELFDNDMNESVWSYKYVDEYESDEIEMTELKFVKR